MIRFTRYTKQQLLDAIDNSTSIAQVLSKIGLAPKGGNYQVVKKFIKQENLDTSHFNGQGWNKGKTYGPKRPIEDYLSNKFTITSHKLRKRLIAEKVFENKCYGCNLTIWLNRPIPLELEHKDGNHDNNTLENLILLCPNCHALTPTYRRKKLVG